MPIHELEIHPFLNIGEAIPSSRMIIGTFPVYSLTHPPTSHKEKLKQERGDISFFYGSRSNYFWTWYKKYLDQSVNTQTSSSIISSLNKMNISISDVVKECSRIDESFEDSKLKNLKWNNELATIIEGKINNIICTSKSARGAMGWLVNKILIPNGFILNKEESDQLHKVIMNSIPKCNIEIKLVAYVLIKGRRKVSIVALPSPGSPYRRLSDFGRLKDIHDSASYLDSYLQSAFNWFML